MEQNSSPATLQAVPGPACSRCVSCRSCGRTQASRRRAVLMASAVVGCVTLLGIGVANWLQTSAVQASQAEHTAHMRRMETTSFLDSVSKQEADKRPKNNCSHGAWDNKNQSCKCFNGWSVAGITDTVDFLQGACEQYHCQSAATCEQVMKIPGASCPIRGWNCYCGWAYAFTNGGYESPSSPDNPGGKCMGAMYTFALWASFSLESFMTHAYKVFLPIAFLLLPFGRKRANCDHHRPSLWLGIRRGFGMPSQCRGECVMASTYNPDMLVDDLAWSLYVLDVGLWSYLFAITFWIVAESIWSILLWMAVIVILLLSLLVGCLSVCGESMGSVGCDCCAGGAGSFDCFDCCLLCQMHGGHSTGIASGSDAMYWSGTFPYDPWWGYSGYGAYDYEGGQSNSCCGCLQLLCKPVAWLLFVFPVMPENAWGGFCGFYIFGTHGLTPPERLYRGGNQVIEFLNMGWRRRADLHADNSWRLQVYNFLSPDETGPSGGGLQVPLTSGNPFGSQEPERAAFVTMEDGIQRQVVTIGRAKAILIGTTFNQDEHQCVPSSFEDYHNNSCWICMGSCDEWDLWLSCKHLFCRNCSSEMLKRRMPCPLCRVSSSTVLRGKAGYEPSSDGAGAGVGGGSAGLGITDQGVMDFQQPRVPMVDTTPSSRQGDSRQITAQTQEARRQLAEEEQLTQGLAARRQQEEARLAEQAMFARPVQAISPRLVPAFEASFPETSGVELQTWPGVVSAQQPESISVPRSAEDAESAEARRQLAEEEQLSQTLASRRQQHGESISLPSHDEDAESVDLHTDMLPELLKVEQVVEKTPECVELLEQLLTYAREQVGKHFPAIQKNLREQGVKDLDMLWPGVVHARGASLSVGYNSVACGGSFEVFALLERSGLLRLGNVMGASGVASSTVLALADPDSSSRTLLRNYMVFAKWQAGTKKDGGFEKQTQIWKHMYERAIECDDAFARLKQRGWVAKWTGGPMIPSHNILHNFSTREQCADAFFASHASREVLPSGDEPGKSSAPGRVTHFPKSPAHLLFYNVVYDIGCMSFNDRCTLESIAILYKHGVDDTIKLLCSADLNVESDAKGNGGMRIVPPQLGQDVGGDEFKSIHSKSPWIVSESADFYNMEAELRYTYSTAPDVVQRQPISGGVASSSASTAEAGPSAEHGKAVPASSSAGGLVDMFNDVDRVLAKPNQMDEPGFTGKLALSCSVEGVLKLTYQAPQDAEDADVADTGKAAWTLDLSCSSDGKLQLAYQKLAEIGPATQSGTSGKLALSYAPEGKLALGYQEAGDSKNTGSAGKLCLSYGVNGKLRLAY